MNDVTARVGSRTAVTVFEAKIPVLTPREGRCVSLLEGGKEPEVIAAVLGMKLGGVLKALRSGLRKKERAKFHRGKSDMQHAACNDRPLPTGQVDEHDRPVMRWAPWTLREGMADRLSSRDLRELRKLERE